MGWRIICIEDALRINYKLNSIGVLEKDEVIWICLDEIDVLIIESQYCNTSIKLLTELLKKGITVIICGDNHMPIGTLNTLSNNQRSAKYNKIQINWSKSIKQLVWKEIVKHKIYLQKIVLSKYNNTEKTEILDKYIEEVEKGDITNREGLAAKIYFRELFGSDFIRKSNADDIINSSFNYLYQVIRSKISQEIVSHGYLSSIGIFHCSEYNYFCLADDIIEVYRPILDYYVIEILENNEYDFLCTKLKEQLLSVLLKYIVINNTKHRIIESIRLVVVSITDVLSCNSINELTFPNLLLWKVIIEKWE